MKDMNRFCANRGPQHQDIKTRRPTMSAENSFIPLKKGTTEGIYIAHPHKSTRI